VLEEQASATRVRGYASEDGEYRDGVRAVAAPLRDPAEGVIAALIARGDTAVPPIP
jgi:DNA-binding IclR family transcriptional regulator